MTQVKICGIKREIDVEYINKYLPTYAGFVFAGTKRKLSPETAQNLCRLTNNRIKKVGVFVNEDIESLLNIANLCRLDVVQLHGDETPDYVQRVKNAGYEVWKAFRIQDNSVFEQIKNYNADKYLLDTYVENEYGGSGFTFDWSIIKNGESIILAGGLTANNVTEAIAIARPFCVDVSSGVEDEFGYKDEQKIREFMEVVARG